MKNRVILLIGGLLIFFSIFAMESSNKISSSNSKEKEVAMHVNKAMGLEKEKKYSEAELEIDKAIAINNDLHQLYLQKGVIQKKMGKLDEAILTINSALKLVGSALGYETLGDVYTEKHENQKAIDSYNKAISQYGTRKIKDPGYFNAMKVELYIKIINILVGENRKHEARGVLDKALEENPGSKQLKDKMI